MTQGGFNETEETLRSFVAETGVTFEVVWDQNTYNSYDWPAAASPFPRQVLLDGEGTLAFWSIDYSYSGFLDREWDVVVAKDENGVVTGSIVSTDGVNCVVSGQDYDYEIDCD